MSSIVKELVRKIEDGEQRQAGAESVVKNLVRKIEANGNNSEVAAVAETGGSKMEPKSDSENCSRMEKPPRGICEGQKDERCDLEGSQDVVVETTGGMSQDEGQVEAEVPEEYDEGDQNLEGEEADSSFQRGQEEEFEPENTQSAYNHLANENEEDEIQDFEDS